MYGGGKMYKSEIKVLLNSMLVHWVNKMKAIIICSAVLAFLCTQLSCSVKWMRPFSPLTELEKQNIGAIGVVAEVAALDALYRQNIPRGGVGLSDLGDRMTDTGEGAWDGLKKGFEWGNIGPCSRYSCLLNVALSTVGMTVGGIAGGIEGAAHRKTYSGSPLPKSPDKSTIQAVQISIDTLGLPEKLRDKVWEKAQGYQAYNFQLVRQLLESGQKNSEELKVRLRDNGIQTIFKIRIPLIEFRGPSEDESYRLYIPVETTVFNMKSMSCVRYRTWEYEGKSHRVAEWNKEGAKVFVEELDEFYDLVARRVTSTYFGEDNSFGSDDLKAVAPKIESQRCLGL